VTAAYLVPCLQQLRVEFNALSPRRDKGADGWIGDAAHQKRLSDHNPRPDGRVLALDVDSTGPWPVDFHAAILYLVDRQRADVDSRLEYVLHDRKQASRRTNWLWVPYLGSDPHTGHTHFSARHDLAGNGSERSWQLGRLLEKDNDMPDVQDLLDGVHRDLSRGPGHPAGPKSDPYPAGESGLHKDVRLISEAAVAPLVRKLDEILDRLSPPVSAPE
jgi:hypothetical protein